MNFMAGHGVRKAKTAITNDQYLRHKLRITTVVEFFLLNRFFAPYLGHEFRVIR
jgi:hypothetical protein